MKEDANLFPHLPFRPCKSIIYELINPILSLCGDIFTLEILLHSKKIMPVRCPNCFSFLSSRFGHPTNLFSSPSHRAIVAAG
jgi:hypothetical protein